MADLEQVTMEKTLQRKYVVSSYDVDPLGKARLTAIANYLQETAYVHAGKLGLGYDDLAANDTAWILSRMKIRVTERPDWDDELTVETWPRGLEKIFALRDFRISDRAGREVAEATTCWLMVNTLTRRPLRIPSDYLAFEPRTDAVFDQTPGKISLPDGMAFCERRQVKYSDLDVVGHVNNVRFIEWCSDALGTDLLTGHFISGFEINFIGEARPGDEVEITCSGKQSTEIFLSGKNITADRECFRAFCSLAKTENTV